MSGIDRIRRERERQIQKWGDTHDDSEHQYGELAIAAGHLLNGSNTKNNPGWALRLRKKNERDRLRQLEIAGALVAAEIDRILRAVC